MMEAWQLSFLILLSNITGTYATYTVTLKASSKGWAGTGDDIVIFVRGPYSSTPDTTMYGLRKNKTKFVNIPKDVGLPSCVTARSTSNDSLLISWMKISSSSYEDVKLHVDEWIETGSKNRSDRITKCRSDCPVAYGMKDGVCRKCGVNTYSDGISTDCKNCPGTQTSDVGATTCRPDKKKVMVVSVSGRLFVALVMSVITLSVLITAAFLLNRRRKRANRSGEAILQGLHNNPMYSENSVDRKENTDEYVYMNNRNPMHYENTKDRKINTDEEEHIYNQIRDTDKQDSLRTDITLKKNKKK